MIRFLACVAFLLFLTVSQAQETQTRVIQQLGLGDGPFDIAVSPDGRTFATAGARAAYLWDQESGEVIRTFQGHAQTVRDVEFSPDGTRLFTAADSVGVVEWDIQSGLQVRVFEGYGSVAVSPDGSMVMTGNPVRVWDYETQEQIRSFGGNNCYDFSPDGTMIVGGGFQSFFVRVIETGELAFQNTSTAFYRDATFSADSRRVLVITNNGNGSTGDDDDALLYDIQTGALVRRFTGHTDKVTSVDVSPDGTRVLTTSLDGSARVWGLNGDLLNQYEGHEGVIKTAIFSVDSTHVYTVSEVDGEVVFWALDGGKAPVTIFSEGWRYSFSPDGGRIAVDEDAGEDHIAVYDAYSGQQIIRRELDARITYVAYMLYSPEGSFLMAGNQHGILLLDPETLDTIHYIPSQIFIEDIDFSPDDNRLYFIGTNYVTPITDWIYVYNTETGALINERSITPATYFDQLSLSSDGQVLAIGSSRVTFYDALSLDAISVSNSHQLIGYGEWLSFFPEGREILIGKWDSTEAIVYDLLSEQKTETFNFGFDVEYGYYDNMLRNGNVATVSETAAYMIDLRTKKTVRTIKYRRDPQARRVHGTSEIESLGSFQLSSDGSRLSATSFAGWEGAGTHRIFSYDSGERRRYRGHQSSTQSLAISSTGTYAVTGSDAGYATVWSAEVGERLLRLSGHSGAVGGVAFSEDESFVVTGSEDDTAILWDRASGEQVRTFTGHSSDVYTVALSPDNTLLATGSADRTARLWNAETGAQLREFTGHAGEVNGVVFSPDGSRLLTGGDDFTARTWDTSSGDEQDIYIGHTEAVEAVAYSHDGTMVLTGSRDNSAKLWNAGSDTNIRTFTGHAGAVKAVAFSPDDTLVLTGSEDNTAKLWDTQTGALLRTFEGHTDSVEGVVFADDGKWALTGSLDGSALLWEINPPRVILVAGSGDYPGNAIGQQTQDLAAYAFRTLKARGYDGTDIQYLSAFNTNQDADGDGLNDIDADATLSAFEDAITGAFGSGAGRLMIVMIGHGYKTGDFMSFRLNETQALPTTTMNDWLNALQNAAPVDVTLLVDCCYSGKFVEDCRKDVAIPEDRDRIVIASTSSDAEAVFLQPPDLTSFIYTFLGSAYMGNSMGEAFRAGERFFASFPVANQQPQIHDGSGATEEADREFFGASWAYGVQSTRDINEFFPVFDEVSPAQTVNPGTPINLYARMLPGQEPQSVVAVIRPPAPAVVSGDPVTALPSVQLSESEPGLWTATVSDDTFAEEGAYTISFSARFPFERLSNPAFSNVTVSSGPDPDATPIRAVLAVGDGGSTHLDAAFQELGSTMSSVYLDRFQDENGIPQPDWVTFLSPYSIRFDRPEKDLKEHERNAIALLSTKRQMPEASVILSAIGDYADEAGRLYIHLLARNAASGSLVLSDTSTLSATNLDAALDAYQAPDSTREVVLIIDAPGSGSFVAPCTGANRIIITSGRDQDSAVYIPETRTSFSHKLLASAWQGNSLQTSYISGRNFFEDFLAYFADPISPQLSDTSSLAGIRFLGRRYAFAGDDASGLPFILSGMLTNGTITATLIEGVTPSRVFAQVIDGSGDPSNPQTIPLSRQQGAAETWTAAASGLTSDTTIVLYAAYPDDGAERLSEPYFIGREGESPAGWMAY